MLSQDSSNVVVFEDDIDIYAGADFIRTYYYEDRSTPISSIVKGATTTINTVNPHYLTTGKTVNLRGVSGIEDINGSFTVTVVDNNTFTIPYNSTNDEVLSGGTANRPVSLTGYQFKGEIRNSLYTNIGARGALATIALNSPKTLIISGTHDLAVGDEISVVGTTIVNATVLSIDNNAPGPVVQSIVQIDQSSNVAISNAKVTRNTKKLADIVGTVLDADEGKFELKITSANTLLIPAFPGLKYYYDVKYKVGASGSTLPLLKGRVQIIPMATQSSI